MKRILRSLALVSALMLVISGIGLAGQRDPSTRSKFAAGSTAHLAQRYYYPLSYYYVFYQAPVLVISPYGPSYYLPPAVVVTAPYFCVFHNHGFVSRVGLLDHLAGTHKIPLDAASAICPDGTGSCIFPSY